MDNLVQKSAKNPSETGKIRLHGGARLLGILSRTGENFDKIDEQFNSNLWYINKVKLKSSDNIRNPLTGTETFLFKRTVYTANHIISRLTI